jgi:hypothetical protein
MGYAVFVTRRKKHWHDPAGESISVAEWRSVVESDPELLWGPELGEHAAIWRSSPESEVEWVDLEAGNLEVKNPSAALLAKLVSVAKVLHAHVEGEDGESYESSGVVLPPPPPTAAERVLSLLSNLKALFAPAEAPDPALGVGARVRDFRGRLGTVTKVNLRAERGLGCIMVQYDSGQSESYSAVAHGLEPV